MSDKLAAGARFGRWVLEAPLPSSARGEAWLAKDGTREVTLLLLPEELVAGERERGIFEEELRSATGLVHANVLRTLAHGVEDGRPYVVRERIAGIDLGSALSLGPLTASAVAAIGVQASRALAYAHGRHEGTQPSLHRDLSPRSIHLGADGVVRVADFGLAGAMQRITREQSGQVQGNLPYMSPEQLRDEELDGRADLFALGAVLFEAAIGAQPFDGELLAERGRSQLKFPAADRLPTSLRVVIERALEADRERRFARAGELASALEACAPAEASELRKIVEARGGRRAAEPVRIPSSPTPAAASEIQLFTFDAGAFSAPATAPKSELPESQLREMTTLLESGWSGDLGDVSESGPLPPLDQLAPIVGLQKHALAAASAGTDPKLSGREATIIGTILVFVALSLAVGYVLIGPQLLRMASPHARGFQAPPDSEGDLPPLEAPAPSTALWRAPELALLRPQAPAGEQKHAVPAKMKAPSVRVTTSTSASQLATGGSSLDVSVRFEARPIQAEVLIDGKSAGPAPVRVELAPGRHHIQVRPAGASPVERTIEVPRGAAERVTFDLSP